MSDWTDGIKWPTAPTAGTFTLKCTCAEFVFVGDYFAMSNAARKHDDSPNWDHVVKIAKHETPPVTPERSAP